MSAIRSTNLVNESTSRISSIGSQLDWVCLYSTFGLLFQIEIWIALWFPSLFSLLFFFSVIAIAFLPNQTQQISENQHVLTVEVLRAENLACTGNNVSDPYVVLYLASNPGEKDTHKFINKYEVARTDVIEKTQHPTWNR